MSNCKIQIRHFSLLGIFLLVFSSATPAQIYKCVTPDGTVFSDNKCGPTATELDLSESLKTSGLGVPVTAEAQDNLAGAKNRRQQGQYINRINQRRDNDLEVIDAQIDALNLQKNDANNNLAGATYGAGIDLQLAALREARASVIADYRSQVMQVERE